MDKDVVHVYKEILIIKMNKTIPSEATWIDLEIVIMSELSQTKKGKLWYFFTVELKKKRYIWAYPQNRSCVTDVENKLMVTRVKGGRDKLGNCDWHIHACVHAKSLQLCLTLHDPRDCSLPGSPIHGIHQARMLEWVTTPSPGDLCTPLCVTHRTAQATAQCPCNGCA